MVFTSPTSYRLANMGAASVLDAGAQSPFMIFKKKPHDSHPSLDRLVLLVFEAVMEVVCVSLPGYIVARLGHFDADKQKFLANLNVMLFTPCLIFTKLASQLNADKLVELGIIPVIFIIQTLVSWLVARGVSKAFGLNRRATNFVTAMGVFGNSNSLPISLVISLSQTLKGLHWDKIPGDNDDEVGARGILYLLIFQQLGQLVRWSWGYHVLLAPKSKYPEYAAENSEEGRYRDEAIDSDDEQSTGYVPSMDGQTSDNDRATTSTDGSIVYEPAGRTPVVGHSRASPAESVNGYDSSDSLGTPKKRFAQNPNGVHPPHYQNLPEEGVDGILSFPRIRNDDEGDAPTTVKGKLRRYKQAVSRFLGNTSASAFGSLPHPVQTAIKKTYNFLWEFMNPPLWAMLLAIIVASVPELQRLFFKEGSFIKNSVTSAVSQSAGVAVPLILVVLGANLARNTQKRDESADPEERAIGTRLLVASLLCRMLLPTLIMAPILALAAKYVPISILDDPIFVIVCFLLTGAPSALQLAQICQLNEVYEGVMARILFQSYVVWVLPSTLVLVMCALEVVEWAR